MHEAMAWIFKSLLLFHVSSALDSILLCARGASLSRGFLPPEVTLQATFPATMQDCPILQNYFSRDLQDCCKRRKPPKWAFPMGLHMWKCFRAN